MDLHRGDHPRRLLASVSILTILAFGPAVPAKAGQITVEATVDGKDQPWSYTPGGLNTDYQYGINDGLAPTIIGASDGFSFSAGGSFTVTYLSGLVSAGPGYWPYVDAGGDLGDAINDSRGSSGNVEPSYYMDHATYPIYLVELVGTFADSSGAIVGTPFALGVGPTTITVPVGATQLQLGVNDDIYHDNAGSFSVSISGPTAASVPEPASLVLLGMGSIALGCLSRRHHRSGGSLEGTDEP